MHTYICNFVDFSISKFRFLYIFRNPNFEIEKGTKVEDSE